MLFRSGLKIENKTLSLSDKKLKFKDAVPENLVIQVAGKSDVTISLAACKLPKEDAAAITQCLLEVDEKGDIILKELLFDAEDKALVGAKITISGKNRYISSSPASGSEPASASLAAPLNLGKNFSDKNITLTLKDGSKKIIDMATACPDREKIEQDIATKEREAQEQARQEMIKAACNGGEGKEVTKRDSTFILCQDGVSESERNMIVNFCHGQSGDYDPESGSIFCAPFKSSAPAALPPLNLPPSPFNGVFGINSKGFY